MAGIPAEGRNADAANTASGATRESVPARAWPCAAAVAERMAAGLGMSPFRVSGDRRLYHAAAVMAGNFTTTLLAEASSVLVQAGVDEADAPRVLAPMALARPCI